jgi:hypothetical protein
MLALKFNKLKFKVPDGIIEKSDFIKILVSMEKKTEYNINLQFNYNKEILNIFFDYILDDLDGNSDYPFEMYQLLEYFQCDKHFKLYKKYVKTIELNNKNMISMYKLNNFYDIGLKKLFKNKEINNEYLDNYEYILMNPSLEIVERLQLYNIWKQNIIINYNCLIIDIFKYIDTDYFDYESIDVELKSPFTKTNKCVNSHTEFINNLNVHSFDLFLDFDWSNIIVSGGFVTGCFTNDILYSSDIDLWIYGHDIEQKKETLIKTLNFFNKNGNKIIYSMNNQVITLCLIGIDRNIQIIFTDKNNPYEIINDFHFDYVKAFYNGTTLYGTSEFINSIKTKTIMEDKSKTLVTTIKAINKGYSFYKLPIHFCDQNIPINESIDKFNNIDYVIKSKHKYYYPQEHELNNKDRLFITIKLFLKSRFVSDNLEHVIDNFRFINNDDAYNTKLNGSLDTKLIKNPELLHKYLINDNISHKDFHNGLENEGDCRKYLLFNQPILITTPLCNYYTVRPEYDIGRNMMKIIIEDETLLQLLESMDIFGESFKDTFKKKYDYCKLINLKKYYDDEDNIQILDDSRKSFNVKLKDKIEDEFTNFSNKCHFKVKIKMTLCGIWTNGTMYGFYKTNVQAKFIDVNQHHNWTKSII